MRINQFMSLSDLSEHMDFNGAGKVTDNEARKMRDLILSRADSYGWKTTSDIEDGDWFQMMDIATARNNGDDPLENVHDAHGG